MSKSLSRQRGNVSEMGLLTMLTSLILVMLYGLFGTNIQDIFDSITNIIPLF